MTSKFDTGDVQYR